jgi:hypothetical protein
VENKKVYRDEPVIRLKESQLNDIIYFACLRASKRALDDHFHGLSPFLYKYLEENIEILNELDYIKSLIKMDVEKNE